MQQLTKTTEGTIVDLETGEVLSIEEASKPDVLFGDLRPPNVDGPLSKADLAQLEDCVDYAVTRLGDIKARAQAFRDMAERKAKPLDERVNRYLELLKPWATPLAAFKLPRAKTGLKAGQYTKKTLELSRAGLKFTKKTGGWQYNEEEVLAWIEKNPSWVPYVHQQVVTKTVTTIDMEGLMENLAKNGIAPGETFPEVERVETDEFAKMELVLPKQGL